MLEITPIISVLTIVQIALCVWMWFLFILGRRLNNYGIVDVGWSGGMALAALSYLFLLPSEVPWRTLLATCLLMIWGLRLSSFILFKRVLGKEEDSRYARLKIHWGESSAAKFLWFVFMPQALLVTLFLLPLLAVTCSSESSFLTWDAVAVGIWVVAVLGESLADRQLSVWRTNPVNRGKTCRSGLWKYSRHPNYFFEWLHWFAYVFLAVSSPLWMLGLLGPVLMFLFLFRITGIPHTEKQAVLSRGDDYKNYQSTTSVFFPWPPKQ